MTAKQSLTIAFLGVLAGTTRVAHAGWTASTSEEFPPAQCPAGSATNGAWCTGRYCDNVALWCVAPTSSVVVNTSMQTNSEQFSEENADVNVQTCLLYADGNGACTSRMLNQGFCGGGVVTGITCAGRYCDNVTLQCSPLSKGYLGPGCSWTAWQSEEQGQRLFPAGQLATGAQCRGSYCDDMSFFTCPVTSLCVAGPKAPNGVNTCVNQICAADPYCCNSLWDPICVGEVGSICGLSC